MGHDTASAGADARAGTFAHKLTKLLLGGGLGLLLGFASPAVAVPTNIDQNSQQLFRFDPQWQGDRESPFLPHGDGYALRVKIGAAYRMVFPRTLDSQTPIVINTRLGAVRQFLASEETYRAERLGRYLVYRGKEQSILFRYDADEKAFREFVYLPAAESIEQDGTVIRWRYEGVELSQRRDGSVAFSRKVDPKGDIKRIADRNMAARISRFLENRRGAALPDKPVNKTVFVAPPPEYVDGKLSTETNGLRYEVQDAMLKLVLNRDAKRAFPLWVDPTLTADTDADVILNGQNAGDLLGRSVSSAGDFNGDGVDDVIVGDELDDNNGTDSGSAFIFFGGVTGTINANSADVILIGQNAGDQFGYSVSAAGDFNGDGNSDVIVGARLDDNNALNSGSAFIFFGGAGVTGMINAGDADVILNGLIGNDQLGHSVSSAGDFNGDGKSDVIVGAVGVDNNGNASGGAFIFFGGSGVTGAINAGSADVILNGQGAMDFFGFSSSSVGDFNGDGKNDVIVGAPFDDNSGSTSGSAFIFFGGATGTINAGSADVILNGQSAGDQFGFSVSSAGDFNGDSKRDVIVGAIRDDNNGTDSGSAFIFFGGATGTINAGSADVILNGQSAGGNFGVSVSSAGDFNGDSKSDVIVGAPLEDSNGADSGSAFIFFGGATGTINASTADVTLNGPGASDLFGFSVSSAGDFNSDGQRDVIVGAIFEDNNGPNSGSAFIFFGSSQVIAIAIDIEQADIRFDAGKAKKNRMNFRGQIDLGAPFGPEDVVVDIDSDTQPTNAIDPVTIPAAAFAADGLGNFVAEVDDPSQQPLGAPLKLEVTIPQSGVGEFKVQTKNVDTDVGAPPVDVTLILEVGNDKTGEDMVIEVEKKPGERLQFEID